MPKIWAEPRDWTDDLRHRPALCPLPTLPSSSILFLLIAALFLLPCTSVSCSLLHCKSRLYRLCGTRPRILPRSAACLIAHLFSRITLQKRLPIYPYITFGFCRQLIALLFNHGYSSVRLSIFFHSYLDRLQRWLWSTLL